MRAQLPDAERPTHMVAMVEQLLYLVDMARWPTREATRAWMRVNE